MNLQPVLAGATGQPDVTLCRNGTQLLVFWGLALVERVCAAAGSAPWKMLAARLYNAHLAVRQLQEVFGVAHTTLHRWGAALQSGDLDHMQRAFAGQGAERKVTPEIERYVEHEYRRLRAEGQRDYNRRIRASVQEIFHKRLSTERLRRLFRKIDAQQQASRGSNESARRSTDGGASSCENDPHKALAAAVTTRSNRNYSLCAEPLPLSGDWLGPDPQLCPHAGLWLLAAYIDEFAQHLDAGEALAKQLVGQILCGAVNPEQSKTLVYDSLQLLLGPTVNSSWHQRRLLGEAAGAAGALQVLRANARLIRLQDETVFYFDPHTREYTGQEKMLLSWIGSKGRVRPGWHLDMVHTCTGQPCLVQAADNYDDMRVRLFVCRARMLLLFDQPRTFEWVIDRGIYGLEAMQQLVGLGDQLITWEKNYDGNGWDEHLQRHRFVRSRPRNRASDLVHYRFSYQEQRWQRDESWRRLIVRVERSNSSATVEVSIVLSSPRRCAQEAIWLIFNRWLQENDFGYMDRHMGLGQLVSRRYEPYCELADEVVDRQVESRAHKQARAERDKLAATLGKELVRWQLRHARVAGAEAVERQRQQLREDGQQLLGELRRELEQLEQATDLSDDVTRRRRHDKLKEWKHSERQWQTRRDRARRKQQVREGIGKLTAQLQQAEHDMAQTAATESRLQALIEDGYVRGDVAKQTLMDALRLSARNIFYQAVAVFRPLYDNLRDDHVILRAVTKSPAILVPTVDGVEVRLFPELDLPPKLRTTIQEFLDAQNKTVNCWFAGRARPVRFSLLAEHSLPAAMAP